MILKIYFDLYNSSRYKTTFLILILKNFIFITYMIHIVYYFIDLQHTVFHLWKQNIFLDIYFVSLYLSKHNTYKLLNTIRFLCIYKIYL